MKKIKMIILIVSIVFLLFIIGQFVNKDIEVIAFTTHTSLDYLNGRVYDPYITSSAGNEVKISANAKIYVDNKSKTSIFRNPNVFCINNGTALGADRVLFTVGNQISINNNSTSTLKGLAYILSYQGKNYGNYNLYNTNDWVQAALWRYIYEYNTDLQNSLGTPLSGISGTSGDSYKLYSIADAIANGCLDNVGKQNIDNIELEDNKITGLPTSLKSSNINGEKIDWEKIVIRILKNNGESEDITYTPNIYGTYTVNNYDEIKTVQVIYKFFDLNAKIHVFSYSGKQRLLVVKEANRYMNAKVKNLNVPEEGSKISIQKYIYAVNGEEVADRSNMLAYDKSAKLARFKLEQFLQYEDRNPNEYYGPEGQEKEYITSRFLQFQSSRITDTIITSRDTTKKNNPVTVNVGDTITYKIIVYNNSNKNYTNIELQDIIDQYYCNDTGDIKHNDKKTFSVVAGGNENVHFYNWEDEEYYNSNTTPDDNIVNKNNCVRLMIDKLDSNESIEINLTYRLIRKEDTTPYDGVIENRVDIISANEDGEKINQFDNTYRIFDEDYIKIDKEYQEITIKKIWNTKYEDDNKYSIMVYISKLDSTWYNSFNANLLYFPIILNEKNNWTCKLRHYYYYYDQENSGIKSELVYVYNESEIKINDIFKDKTGEDLISIGGINSFFDNLSQYKINEYFIREGNDIIDYEDFYENLLQQYYQTSNWFKIRNYIQNITINPYTVKENDEDYSKYNLDRILINYDEIYVEDESQVYGGILKRENIITNSYVSKNPIKLIVKKEINSPDNIEKPSKIGFILECSSDEGKTWSNYGTDGLSDPEIIYIDLNSENKRVEFSLDGDDAEGNNLKFRVREVYVEFSNEYYVDEAFKQTIINYKGITADEISTKIKDIEDANWIASYSDNVGDPNDGIVEGDNISENQSATITITNSWEQDVSLQKYIVKVDGVDISGRENQKAVDGSINEIYSLGARIPTTSGTLIKSKNPVEINKGAQVTYKISVYNNLESKATDVYVIDDLPTSITGFNVKGYSYEQITNKQIKINIGDINGKTQKDIEVTVTFPDRAINSDAERTNTATVFANNNQTAYRTTDSDYVVMTRVDLSLQKYIVQLNTGNANYNIDDRADRKATRDTKDPIYKGANGNVNSSGEYKSEDPVYIDSGDTVKYNINIYNNGDKNATGIIVKDTLPTKATQYRIGDSGNYTKVSGGSEITLISNLALNANESKTITIYVKLESLNKDELYENKAKLTDADQVITGNYRIEDSDYVKKAIYAVSLEKYVTKVEATSSSYSTNAAKDYGSGRQGQAEHKYDNDANTNNYIKSEEKYTQISDIQVGKGPVPVNSGDSVTYKIIVTNNGNVPIEITEINDVMDVGIENNNQNPTTEKIIDLATKMINPGESATVTRSYDIEANQVTPGILKNNATITQIKNKYGKEVIDTTLNDNSDSDYIRLKGITISGIVWEDTSNNKGNTLNHLYDDGDTLKDGIKVILQQSSDGTSFTNYKDTTTSDGQYVFDDVPHSYKKQDGSYGYYTYKVVFEYDGVTYTNSDKGAIDADNYKINSNAEESGREEFNNKFAEIRYEGAYNSTEIKTGDITYQTINEDGKAPMSVHNYNPDLMKITSSTDTINLQGYSNQKLEYLKYLNLGLRGRDVFDLRLSTEVDSANVTVNGVTGTYTYNSKTGIQIRDNNADNDAVMTDDISDMIRDNQEPQTSEEQKVRDTDKTALNAIEVTYKVTVSNESQTKGQAIKITDYFDKKFEFTGAEYNGSALTTGSVESGNDNYNNVTIIMPDKILNQSESIEIYLKFNITNDGLSEIKNLSTDINAAFYNMAEIESYKTQAGEDGEKLRGLLDRDSAPGSANKETVRLSSGSSNNTTVQYYFEKQNLSLIKYEDDTSTAPTLVFVIDENMRTLEGTVFEDDTQVTDEDGDGIYTRSGDGKLGNKYPPNSNVAEEKIAGIKVELIEVDNSGNPIKTYTKTTRIDGTYTFEGFLPGKYIIKYTYCGDEKTIYYNGQAYQSTNNSGFDKIDDQYWYVYNNGYSVATDDEDRRETVTSKWEELDHDSTAIFRAIEELGRDADITVDSVKDKLKELGIDSIEGINIEDDLVNDKIGEKLENIINNSNMYAQTATMMVELEMPDGDGNKTTKFGNYDIKNANFGLALRPNNKTEVTVEVQKFLLNATDGTQLALAERNEEGELEVKKGRILNVDGKVTAQITTNLLHGAAMEIQYAITVKNNSEQNYEGYVVAKDDGTVQLENIKAYIDDATRFTADVDANNGWTVETNSGTKTNNKDNITYTFDTGKEEGKIERGKDLTINYTVTQVLTNDETATFAYNGAAEITLLKSSAGRTPEGSILDSEPDPMDTTSDDYAAGTIYLAKQESDTGVAPLITITPPTGENKNYTEIIIISIASIAIVAVGIIGIKKFMKRSK